MDDLTTAAITAGRAEQPSGARAGWAAAHIFSSLTGGDYESDGDLKTYASVFVRDFEGPYALQRPNASWRTRHRAISDPLISAHLRGEYWVATKASWYPPFFYLDFDSPQADQVGRALDRLGAAEGQYLLMTSPSYALSGNCHVALRLEYKERPPTHALGYEALRRTVGDLCEVYPQAKRKFRLPLGRGQHLISDSQVQHTLSWRQAMGFLLKLDPLPIESLPNAFSDNAPSGDAESSGLISETHAWASRAECQTLRHAGLQAFGTRHHAQWQLIVDRWRSGWLPEDAARDTKRWIRSRHNGYSQSVNRGAWRVVDGEIDRQVAWIYYHFKSYPDTVHNSEGALTIEDLRFIARTFPGDLVRQKRLARLVAYDKATSFL